MENQKKTIFEKIYQTIFWFFIFPFGLLAYFPSKFLLNDDNIIFKDYITDYFKFFKEIWRN